jgi:hypothetical protein
VVVSRGWVTNNANLWPFIHLSVLAPIIIAIWLLRQPRETIDETEQNEALT